MGTSPWRHQVSYAPRATARVIPLMHAQDEPGVTGGPVTAARAARL